MEYWFYIFSQAHCLLNPLLLYVNSTFTACKNPKSSSDPECKYRFQFDMWFVFASPLETLNTYFDYFMKSDQLPDEYFHKQMQGC